MAEVVTKPSRRITNMVAKELRLVVKDKVALFLIFLLPAALIGTLYFVTEEGGTGGTQMDGGESSESDGVANETPYSDITLGLIDFDTTRTYDGEDLSTNLTAFLRNLTGELIEYNTSDDAFDALYEKEIIGYVVIPDGFEANLTINEPTYVEVHTDATELADQSTVQGIVQGAIISFRASHMWIQSEVFPSMTMEFVPDAGYIESQFGGFIVIFSSYLGIAMTAAQSIVGDIPLRRMLLTPTNRFEVILAKVAGYVVIGFFQSLLLITLWIVVFNLHLNTGFLTLVLIMSLVSLTGSATGILISAVASSRLQANQMFLFVLFGTLILAGFFIDVGALDEILPLNQGLDLLISTAFKGLNIFEVWLPIMKLLGFSLLAILAATVIFSKKPTLG
ncbi:MAG: ABC transporter permease [Promethearchaeia archaeon]